MKRDVVITKREICAIIATDFVQSRGKDYYNFVNVLTINLSFENIRKRLKKIDFQCLKVNDDVFILRKYY